MIKTNLEPNTKTIIENKDKSKSLKQTTLTQFLTNQIYHLPKEKTPTTDPHNTKEKQINYLPIPYIKGFTEDIKKTIKNLDFHEIKLTSKPINKINNKIVSQLKDKIPPHKKTFVIYEIDCTNCNKKYIGQTKQSLKNRIDQHKSNTTSKNKLQNKQPSQNTAF